jgi:type I restriction enzyme, S subunit
MSHAWPKVPLVELLRQTSDAHPVIAGEEYPNFGILSFGRGLFSKPAISGARSSAKTLFRARKGQFIYSRLFAFEGAYGLVTDGYDGHFVSNEYPMFDCDEERILPEYLHSYFKSPRVWENVARLSTGMGDRRRRIQPEQLLTHRLPLPPLPEQWRIVARIEELAGKISEAKQLQRKVDEQLVDFVSSLHNQLSENREVDVGSFLELYEVKEQVLAEGRYPQVGVRGFGGGLFTKPPVSGGDTTYRTFNKLFGGALVLSQVKGREGAVGVAGTELAGWYVSPEYRTFRCKQ